MHVSVPDSNKARQLSYASTAREKGSPRPPDGDADKEA